MQLAKYVKFREEQFGGVLFETQTEKVYTLNAAGAAVIRELRAGYDVEQIAARLKDRFEDPDGKIESDVRALVGELGKKGLISEIAV
jgi:DNA-binding PadR family transcriptional regulator